MEMVENGDKNDHKFCDENEVEDSEKTNYYCWGGSEGAGVDDVVRIVMRMMMKRMMKLGLRMKRMMTRKMMVVGGWRLGGR